MSKKENKDYEREKAFFQKVDRIISGDIRIKVINNRHTNAIAFINMKTKEISLSFKQIEDLTPKEETEEIYSDNFVNNKTRFIAHCKGFNYHELAHNEYTKYTLEDLQSLTNAENNTMAIIDDGRIESLWVTAYPRIQKYFLNCFVTMIHSQKNKKPSPEIFLLAESRKLFLPKKIIYFYQKLFEEKYTPQTTKKIKELIEEFLTSTKIPRQLEIAREINKFLETQRGSIQNIIYEMKVNSVRHTSSKGGYKARQINDIKELEQALKDMKQKNPELDEKEQKLLTKIVEKQKKLDEIEESRREKQLIADENYKDWQKKEAEKTKKKKEFDKEVDERRKSSTPTQSTKKEEELLKEIEQLDNEIQNTIGKRKGLMDDAQKEREEEIKERNEIGELQNELIDEIGAENEENEQEIDAEVSNDLKTIYQEEGGKEAGVGESNFEINEEKIFTPSPHHRLIAKKLARTINKIQNDTSKGRIPRQETGDINTDRAMNFKKTGDLKIFDKYAQDDRRATKIGVVIIIDSSSSMTPSNFIPALESVWAINEAVTKTKNKTIIIEFSNDYKIIKNFNDRKGDFKRHFSGGTVPIPALLEAQKQMKLATKSERIENWIIYILTDGEWSDNQGAEKIIKELNANKKCVTHLIHFLPNDSNYPEEAIPQHECTHKTVIKGDIQKLEPILRKTLTKIAYNIRTRLNKIKGV